MTGIGAGWRAALDRDVRANPHYRLRSLASLPETYRRSLEALGVETATAGWLLVADRNDRLPDKVVDQAGADLFTALQKPGPIPGWAAGRLAELVLDGVLEVACDDGFLCGPRAFESLAGSAVPQPPPAHRLARLSAAALDYLERLRLSDVLPAAARLYCYHRLPWSRRWARAYPGPASVLELLGGPALDRQWVGPAHGKEDLRWLSFRRRDSRATLGAEAFPYKLYVSPRIESLPAVLPRLADALAEGGAARFKLGPDAFGLLRPDKIVVYLRDVAELEVVAAAVSDVLDGAAPHGVPFSAPLRTDGLLSWGGDPPLDAGPVGAGVESWRWSVCRRLAEAVVAAEAAGLTTTRPADFAMARLAMDGVDVRSFAPLALAPPRPLPVVV